MHESSLQSTYLQLHLRTRPRASSYTAMDSITTYEPYVSPQEVDIPSNFEGSGGSGSTPGCIIA